MNDTIFAVSSGAPPCAIAVLRVSGPRAFAVATLLGGSLPPVRTAGLRRLRDPADGTTLDRGLVLLFPGPNSATGDDIAEFHLHGGRAVVRAVERAIGAVSGCRPAEAGEFTRRALEAGRIDLTEAEGFADLLVAETESQRRAALRNAEGGLRRRIDVWTAEAVRLAAQIEAVIDHSDEEDAADEARIVAAVGQGITRLADEIAAVLAQPSVDRLRDGIRVVFAGPPNSGKSSLFNAMIGREGAIVSPIAGTTRDRIEAPVVRGGVAWLLTDTAGLTDATADPIEAIGVERARASAGAADVVLWLGDGAPEAGLADRAIEIHAKCDLPGRASAPAGRISVSAGNLVAIEEVWRAMDDRASTLVPAADALAMNDRQRRLCCAAHEALCDAAKGADPLIFAEELRLARRALDQITGRADVENVLDTLFSGFCIGK